MGKQYKRYTMKMPPEQQEKVQVSTLFSKIKM